MKSLPHAQETLLVRTDFSDEAAWQRLRTVVTTPDEEDGFLASLHIVDDSAYRNLTAEQVVALAPAEEELLIVADQQALTVTEMPLLALCMSGDDGDGEGPGFGELRVAAQQLWSIENNISLANMDWEEFV
ncbi:DUF6924 domain-containing protein, partial [Streptomyces sp. 4N124]|uniref:DUF6924 domain-containing protein n=1 Tax=Streptomyces sp. 4N124 TaxID=3457420 RepID=UPI003FD6BECF